MLPIPTGPITERNEFSAGLLLKAHKINAAFCLVWLRLNWIMFWACGRVKIQASALCPKCNARKIAGIEAILDLSRRSLHVGL
jgi:hypothetical protein